MDEIEVLSGSALSEKIRHVCKGKKVDCAVAFWGVGIRKALFGEKSLSHVRIICDISMGCTTQAALSELGAWENKKLTVKHGLHAKLFLSELGAVIGSANASNNGVGLKAGSGGKLFEMGVCCPPNSDAYQKAKLEFKAIWDPTQWVTKAIWQQAERKSREPGESFHDASPLNRSLIERLRINDRSLQSVSIVMTSRDTDDDEEKIAKKVTKASLPEGLRAEKWLTVSYDKNSDPLQEVNADVLSLHIDNKDNLVVEGYSHCIAPDRAMFHLIMGQEGNNRLNDQFGVKWLTVEDLTNSEKKKITSMISSQKHDTVQTVSDFLALMDGAR